MSLLKVDRALAVLFPRRCVLCGARSGGVHCCAGCGGDLPWILAACRTCGAPLPAEYTGGVCAHCPTTMIDRTLSALVYEYPLDRLITLAKFQVRPDYARVLGELLSLYLLALRSIGRLAMPDVIVPVPLHRFRLARRGYNQASEIVRPVSRALGLTPDFRGVRRTRHTREQTSLTGRARHRNMANAFVARTDFTDRHVAVVDDVITTGSTAQAMVCALRAAGAAGVQVWSVARTVKRTRN